MFNAKSKNETTANSNLPEDQPILELPEDQPILMVQAPEWPLYRMYEVITHRGPGISVIDVIAESRKDGRTFTVREFARNRDFMTPRESAPLDNAARKKAFLRLQDRLDYDGEAQGLDPR